LEAFLAVNRSTFHRTEWYLRLGSTLCTNCGIHLPRSPVASAAVTAALVTAFPAALGFILKTFFGEEFLFTCGENELPAAILAHYDFVFKHLIGSLTFLDIKAKFPVLTGSSARTHNYKLHMLK